MTVQHEIKSQLAKLLATEDLMVEHKNVETAQFNVHTRVLQLPNWNTSNRVYDMLVAHEVGHALFTPDVDPPKSVPHTFMNIAEDVRIEKLMKRKYMGLAKTFYRGYNELADDDFFEIDGKDVDTLNLADRVNLYFKIGSFVNISFSSTETPIVNLIKDAETFDEAVSAAETLYNFCKQGQEEQKQEQEVNVKTNLEANSQGSGVDNSDSTGDDSDTDSGDGDSVSVEDSIGSNHDSAVNNLPHVDDTVPEEDNVDSPEPDVKTVESLDRKLKDLVDNDEVLNVYAEVPKVDLDKVIVKNKILHERIKLEWQDHEESEDTFYEPDEEYREFKRNAQKEVNYLVKEFECKKSADAYARATTSKTGVLNTSILHTYKFNEDLFKKITVIPDGKNHGLVFILDWSGSMQYVIKDTLKQLYNLIWFCRKVNIPFDVYAFTMDYPLWTEEDGVRHSVYEKREGVFQLCDNFSLMNFFTSDVNSKTLEEQMQNIYRIAHSFTSYSHFLIPIGLRLSGTPLNETIMALQQILPKFKEDNKLQKVQCVILTDGEASQLTYHKEVQRHWEDSPYLGCGYVTRNTVLRDRKLGTTYSFNVDGWAQITDVLLRNLRDRFTDMNLIGIRVLSPRDGGNFIRRYHCYGKEFERLTKDWKKDKAFAIKDSGYHTYFGLSSAALANDDDFEVKTDATKAQIKRAFVKSLKGKKMNKKVLSEFVELVA